MICKEIRDYIDLIRSGEIPVCREQAALADYVERCFDSEDIHTDEEQLHRYLNFQKYFPFNLLAWETFIFALHNCTYRADGHLRWPTLFALVGRGAGKNGYLAFESFCQITPVNGVNHYDVDVFATSEDQAKTSPDDVREVLENNRAYMEKRFYWNQEVIINKKTKSRIRFRTSGTTGYKTKDGGRPGAVDFDEYHAYENHKLTDVAETGLGKKRHPRKTIITTDGYVRGGPLDELKEMAEGILFRGVNDGGFLPFICKLDCRDEISKPELWAKANPSLPFFPDLKYQLDLEYAAYRENPSAASSFVVKRMNLPADREDKDITGWENIKACNRPLPDLTGCPCVCGIDYSKTTDFVAAGLLFKRLDTYYWITHTWVCKNSPDLPRIKAPLEEWEERGLLTFVDGPEIPPETPVEWIEELSKKYVVTAIGLDNFRYTLLAKSLKEHGFDTDKDGANNLLLTKRVTVMRWAPVIESAFVTRSIVWGDNPLMSWYANNTCTSTDKDGNITYQKKEAKSRKTDGFMALVSAMCASGNLTDSREPAGDFDIGVFIY